MNKELEAIKKLTLNLHNVKKRSTDKANILSKSISVEKYRSDLCFVYSINKPISKIIPKE